MINYEYISVDYLCFNTNMFIGNQYKCITIKCLLELSMIGLYSKVVYDCSTEIHRTHKQDQIWGS